MGKRKQQPKKQDQEIDLHIWMMPETENMEALYTVSIGMRAVCVDMPINEAVNSIRGVLDDMEAKG